jgi:carbonic anhydrase
MHNLMRGLHQFKTEIHSPNQKFFEELARGQSPKTLFICCSDSRVNPNLITQTDPGDLFILRNAGNIIPPYDGLVGGELATVEYAVVALGVQNIIVCGHSNCGAVQALLSKDSLETMPAVKSWLEHACVSGDLLSRSYDQLDQPSLLNVAVQENVLAQLEHLRGLPAVSSSLWKREVELHGWVFEIETGEVYSYDPIYEQFLKIRYSQSEGTWNLEPPPESATDFDRVNQNRV